MGSGRWPSLVAPTANRRVSPRRGPGNGRICFHSRGVSQHLSPTKIKGSGDRIRSPPRLRNKLNRKQGKFLGANNRGSPPSTPEMAMTVKEPGADSGPSSAQGLLGWQPARGARAWALPSPSLPQDASQGVRKVTLSPRTRPDRRAKKGRAWRAGERRERRQPGTHVLAVAAPREPGRRRDKSANCPAGKTRVAGALPRPLWDAGGLTRWSGSVLARDPQFAGALLAS